MRPLAVLTSLLFAATLLVAGSAVSADAAAASAVPVAQNGKTVKRHLRSMIKHLKVSAERPKGYDRDKFKQWVDADHDCQDTRAEVLVQESKKRTKGACTIRTGKWFSYYDHKTFKRASGLDIDHLVPLAEVWRSGGRGWTSATREAYANDLGDRRTLVAVSAHANRSKSDRDPAHWMPAYGKCTYVNQWAAVKTRWHLHVNRAERRALLQRAKHCKDTLITVRLAKVTKKTSGSGGGSGGGGLDPRFDYCYEAKAAGYGPYYKGVDEEYWWYTDSDSDGIVCE